VAQYSPLLSESVKRQIAQSPAAPSIKERFPRDQLPLSELPLFLNKTYTLDVPVFTVWGACEDVQVLEKLRSKEYSIDNLHIIDEAHSRLLDVGGVKLRILGLGGAVVMHKLFDNGEGRTTIAGGQGTMWTTLLQMGELVDTANRVYDPAETRIFVTHASPAREGLLNQLSVTLKSDFSISAGLHFRYGSSYNEFSVNPTLDHYRGKLAASKASFDDVWQTVKNEVEPAVLENEAQHRLLTNALELVTKMPTVATSNNPFGSSAGTPGLGQIDESAFKNMWNFNLADAAYGWLVLDIEAGRIGTEMRAQGFNFAHRSGKTAPAAVQTSQAPPTPAQVPSGPPRVQQPGPSRQTPPTASAGNRGPSTGPKDQAQKPGTPSAPAAAPTGPAEKGEAKTNGAAQDKTTESKADGAGALPERRREPPPPSQSLFVRYAKDEEEARGLIAEEDKSKVDKIDKSGTFFIVHFGSPEDMQAAYRRISSEFKQARGATDTVKPHVSIYRAPNTRDWGAPRGGASAGGYRSGGGASDSDTARGGFSRGRGRGRGGERGDRGDRGDRGGRGGPRGGRGGFNKPEGSAPSTPAPAADP
jgi:hypothetical protein